MPCALRVACRLGLLKGLRNEHQAIVDSGGDIAGGQRGHGEASARPQGRIAPVYESSPADRRVARRGHASEARITALAASTPISTAFMSGRGAGGCRAVHRLLQEPADGRTNSLAQKLSSRHRLASGSALVNRSEWDGHTSPVNLYIVENESEAAGALLVPVARPDDCQRVLGQDIHGVDAIRLGRTDSALVRVTTKWA